MRPPRITPEAIENARAVMELGSKTTAEDIKAAYRALAKRYHPDICTEADARVCHEKMVAINAAYSLLLASQGVTFVPEKEMQEYERWWWEHFGEGPV